MSIANTSFSGVSGSSTVMGRRKVKFPTGAVVGKIKRDVKGKLYYSFTKIPYARCERFKTPKVFDNWQAEIKELRVENRELYDNSEILYSRREENILYLNVYTSVVQFASRRPLQPVMLFLLGESYAKDVSQTEFYAPDYLLAEEVVVVTVYYRTGILGFLQFEDPKFDIPGNAGLKDILLALQWVQLNISAFMGDPLNVTLWGQGMGAACVHHLLLNPGVRDKRLFRKVIMQSGSALNSWACGQLGAKEYGRRLGYTEKSVTGLCEFLCNLPLEQLLMPEKHFTRNFSNNERLLMGPTVKVHQTRDFLNNFVDEIVDFIRPVVQIPIIMGYNSREGIIAKIVNPSIDNNLNQYEPVISRQFTSRDPKRDVHNFFYGKHNRPSTKDFCDLVTDIGFSRAILESMRRFKQKVCEFSPIYFYRFALDTDLNIIKRQGNIQIPGACHGDELGYLFKTPLNPEIAPDSEEDLGISTMVTLWTTFAKTGNPNAVIRRVTWIPWREERKNYLDIGNPLLVDVDPDHRRMQFWDGLSKLVYDPWDSQ